MIREAFKHLNNAYGDKFAPLKRRAGENGAAYEKRVHETLDTWAGALGHLTPQEIKVGVVRCIREVRFAELITPADIVSRAHLEPEEMGLPSARAAYVEAARAMAAEPTQRQWGNAVVYAAARTIPANEWRTLPESAVWPQFERAYAIACRRYQVGEHLEVPVAKALPARAAARPAEHATVARLAVETAEKCRSSPSLRAALLRLASTAAAAVQGQDAWSDAP